MFWGELDRYTQIRGVGEVLGFAYLLPQTTWLAQWNCDASQDTELASLFAASCILSMKVNASLCYFGIPFDFLACLDLLENFLVRICLIWYDDLYTIHTV